MGSPFLILESDVYWLTLIQSHNLNHTTRRFWPRNPSETRNLPKRTAELVFNMEFRFE
jgi:hypothetical protein